MTLNPLMWEDMQVPGENEYRGEDGLIYCSICREPKETMFPPNYQFSRAKTHPRRCACERAKYEQEEQRRQEESHLREVERLKSICFPGRQMWDWTFEASRTQGKAFTAARQYESNSESKVIR